MIAFKLPRWVKAFLLLLALSIAAAAAYLLTPRHIHCRIRAPAGEMTSVTAYWGEKALFEEGKVENGQVSFKFKAPHEGYLKLKVTDKNGTVKSAHVGGYMVPLYHGELYVQIKGGEALYFTKVKTIIDFKYDTYLGKSELSTKKDMESGKRLE